MGVRVAVFGAGGRMGTEVCRAVAAHPGLELVAAVDPRRAGVGLAEVAGLAGSQVVVQAVPSAVAEAGAEVAVDFTVAEAAMVDLAWCARQGVHAVVGTTGLSPADVAEVGRMFEAGPANCLLAPNFAIGAVLMIRFAELAAPWMDSAEVIELHHDAKVDAPSGTAIHTAERMAEARHAARAGDFGPDPTERGTLAGARGASAGAGIRVHSVRLRGLVAHQEVLLGATGQSLTVRHDSYDRTSFMPGVVLAIQAVAGRRGLTVGLDALLGM